MKCFTHRQVLHPVFTLGAHLLCRGLPLRDWKIGFAAQLAPPLCFRMVLPVSALLLLGPGKEIKARKKMC